MTDPDAIYELTDRFIEDLLVTLTECEMPTITADEITTEIHETLVDILEAKLED